MAIDEGPETVTLQKTDRACRIEIFIADDDTIQLRFHRERIFKLGGVIQHRKTLPTTERAQAQIAAKTYTTAAGSKTGNQILALLNKMADDERAVDIG